MTDIQTLALLIIVMCNLGVLGLYLRLRRVMRHNFQTLDTHVGEDVEEVRDLLRLTLGHLSEAAERQRGMKQALMDDGKLTRERIAQVKTRLADEESDDQRAKRRERAKA